MTNRTAAQRYARALFDVAVKEQADLSIIDGALAAFADLFAQATLSRLLLNPAVPAPRKRAAVDEATRHAGVHPMVARLLVLLADRDRLVLLPDLLAAYRDRVLTHRGIVRADVTTASALAPERTEAIARSLEAFTGRHISLTTRVDQALIGGVVTRIGSTVYDGSVATQLRKMRQRLMEGLH